MCYCNYKPRQTCIHSRESIILTGKKKKERRRNTLLCINDFIKQISQDFLEGDWNDGRELSSSNIWEQSTAGSLLELGTQRAMRHTWVHKRGSYKAESFGQLTLKAIFTQALDIWNLSFPEVTGRFLYADSSSFAVALQDFWRGKCF